MSAGSHEWRGTLEIGEDGRAGVVLEQHGIGLLYLYGQQSPRRRQIAERVIACVNPMNKAGISDPAALAESHAELLEAWKRLLDAPPTVTLLGSGAFDDAGLDLDSIQGMIARAKAARGQP